MLYLGGYHSDFARVSETDLYDEMLLWEPVAVY